MLQIAGYEVSEIVTEHFRLDGGAMFGVVPKTLWNKLIPADEKNRITLACRLLVLRGHGRVILIDTGCGRKWDDKGKEMYAIEHLHQKHLHELVPDVTDLVLTHLHFDHGGGVSWRDNAGALQLSFPNARVFLQEGHWKHANNPGLRERASYLKDNLEPLKKAKLTFTNSGDEILPQIKVFSVSGHTKCLQWVLIGDGKDALAYVADLIPTSHHVPVPYVMGYDLCAETSMDEKAKFLEQAAKEQWLVVFEHDVDTPAARIQKDDKGRFTVGEKVRIN